MIKSSSSFCTQLVAFFAPAGNWTEMNLDDKVAINSPGQTNKAFCRDSQVQVVTVKTLICCKAGWRQNMCLHFKMLYAALSNKSKNNVSVHCDSLSDQVHIRTVIQVMLYLIRQCGNKTWPGLKNVKSRSINIIKWKFKINLTVLVIFLLSHHETLLKI